MNAEKIQAEIAAGRMTVNTARYIMDLQSALGLLRGYVNSWEGMKIIDEALSLATASSRENR